MSLCSCQTKKQCYDKCMNLKRRPFGDCMRAVRRAVKGDKQVQSMDVRDKRILVTGGAVRIGCSICQSFAASGAEIIIHCRNSVNEAKALSESLGGGKHRVIQADLSVHSEVAEVFKAIGAPVDILINNASRYEPASLLESGIDSAKLDFDVNFFAPLLLMQQFFRQYQGDSGLIINILDQEIGRTTITSGSYGLSRKALLDATLAAAVEMAPRVRVNGLALGPVMPPPDCGQYTMQKTLEKVPLRRKVELCEVGSSCLFLAANDSMTGQILYLDGGQHLL